MAYINGQRVMLSAEMSGGKENVTWHQCPTAVRNYLDNVTYDPTDYTTSQIANYAPSTAVSSNTKPIGETVDGVSYYNEVPNVKTPFASTNKAGTVKPLDRLRWINSQTVNMRDLGGWTCDGGTVKYGKLFRGGEPDAADKALALSLGIRHELNLRGNEVPIRDYSVWGIEYTQFSSYTWNVDSSAVWADILGAVFDCVNHNIPLFFHCYAGADRSGAVALVIEAILGMSQSEMDKDYELTCFYSGTDTDANARRRNETDWTTNINYIKSVPLMSGLTDSFRNRAISFAVANGITIDEINAFRANVIDGNPEIITPTSITNLVDTIGYAADTRVSVSDGGNRTGATGIASFGLSNTVDKMIAISAGDVIRIKGVSFPSASDSKCAFVTYKSDGTFYYAVYLSTSKTHLGSHADVVYNGDLTTITIPSAATHEANDCYLRICGLCSSPSTVIITKNEVIS